MNIPINTGLIGFGLSGRVFHAPFIHTHPGFSLSSVVERHHSHSAGIYPYVGVVSDYQKLLEDDTIELVVVATPNTHHFTMVRDGLRAGKHVVVEKPFTPASAEADKLISISEETGKKIFVYQNRRWDGDFLTIRKLLAEGKLGQVKYYEAHFDRYSPDMRPGAWRDEALPGGGILYDLGSHLVDQALCLFGQPTDLSAETRSEREGSPVDDFFRIEMTYPARVVVLTAGMMVKESGPRFIVKGNKGTFIKEGIDPQEAALKAGEMPAGEGWGADKPEFYGKLGDGRTVPTEKGNYMAFYDNVYDVLRKNIPVAVSPEQARDVIFIIEKAIESAKNRKPVKIN